VGQGTDAKSFPSGGVVSATRGPLAAVHAGGGGPGVRIVPDAEDAIDDEDPPGVAVDRSSDPDPHAVDADNNRTTNADRRRGIAVRRVTPRPLAPALRC
jgi:hypothetical protein